MGRELPHHVLLLALTLVGCDRGQAPQPVTTETVAAEQVTGEVTGPAKIVVPLETTPTAPPAKVAVPTVGTPAPPTDEVPPVAAPAPAVPEVPTVGAAPREVPSRKGIKVPADSPNAAAPADPATPFAPKVLLSDKLYRVELAPLPPCKAGATCEAKLIVHALGGYKVNAEYPTKFVAAASTGVPVEGTGSFAVAGKTTGTMTLKLRPAAAGTAKVAGALKLSVCTDEICEIAAPQVAFDVAATAP